MLLSLALHSQAAALLPASQRLCPATTVARRRTRRACVTSSAYGQASFFGSLGADGACTFHGCNKDEPGCGMRKPQSLTARLQSYGFAGVASYGLLNTAYYIIAFIFFWTRIAKVPKGNTQSMSTGKIARVAAAVAMAPLLDAACSHAQQQLGLRSKQTALSLVVALCLGAAALCFGGTVLLWA